MATITTGYTFVNNETVTPAKLNSLAGGASISGIVTADIADSQITTAKIADGAITGPKLNSSVILVPTGAVMPFAMNSAPTGWLAANGSAVSRTTYSALFAAIGTVYGAGDGSTTFALPNLQASFIRGAGTDGVATAGAFGVKQADSVITHTHSGTTGAMSANASHSHTISATGLGSGGSGAHTVVATGPTGNITSAATSVAHTHDFTSSSMSPAGATETRPRNIAMLYCIKF